MGTPARRGGTDGCGPGGWPRRILDAAGRGLRRLARLVAGLIVALLLALLVGALWPENRHWQEPERGITIFVAGTAAHTELILPVAAAGHDWRDRISGHHFRDRRTPAAYLSFSWGERNFFLTTETWADFRLSAGLRALVRGHETLIHVYRIDGPPEAAPLRLSEAQYRRLVSHLGAQFAESREVISGYGETDSFFPARGRYTPFRTCNQWTRDALAEAGVRVGRWTPLAQSLMWRFRREEEAE